MIKGLILLIFFLDFQKVFPNQFNYPLRSISISKASISDIVVNPFKQFLGNFYSGVISAHDITNIVFISKGNGFNSGIIKCKLTFLKCIILISIHGYLNNIVSTI